MSAVTKVRKLAQWAWEKDQERVTSGRNLEGPHYGAGFRPPVDPLLPPLKG